MNLVERSARNSATIVSAIMILLATSLPAQSFGIVSLSRPPATRWSTSSARASSFTACPHHGQKQNKNDNMYGREKETDFLSMISFPPLRRKVNGQVKASSLTLPPVVSSGGITTTSPPSTSTVVPETVSSQQQLAYGETAQRSFAKAVVWRFTAAVVTLVSGLVYSGSMATAISIVGSDLVTKSATMFFGERLWNKVKWGQGKTGDSAKRSLAKALLWRVFAASNTLICGIFLAKDLSVASKIAGTDTVFKTALFFLNERVWASINWGKQYDPEYFI